MTKKLELKPKIYEYIANYIKGYGIGPSIKEISNEVSASQSTVSHYFKILEQEESLVRNGAARYYELPIEGIKSNIPWKSLAVYRPDIYSKLDFDRLNEVGIDPTMIALNSNESMPFICGKNNEHKFPMIVANMTRKNRFRCLYCDGHLIKNDNILEKVCVSSDRMDLVDQYSEKNKKKSSEISANAKTLVKWKCPIHKLDKNGKEYLYGETVRGRLLHFKGCPKCNNNGKSFIEAVIGYYLQKKFECESNKELENYKYDWFIKELGLLIEYDGIRWHRNSTQIKNDNNKNNIVASLKEYRLLRIRELGCPNLKNNASNISELVSKYNGKETNYNSINNVINDIIYKIEKLYSIEINNINVNVDRDIIKIYKFYNEMNSKCKVKTHSPHILDFLVNKNLKNTIGEISIFNQAKIDWKCDKCGEKYKKAICYQIKYKKPCCDACREKNELENRSIEKHENINKVLVFNEELNGIKKSQVYAKSGKVYYFECIECGYIDLYQPYRVYDNKNPILCRKCYSNGIKLSYKKSLAGNMPNYIEWDYSRNNDRPVDCFASSAIERHFIDLRCNHPIKTQIRNVARGGGCQNIMCKKKH